MPSLICPSPLIMDHTFPRDENELQMAYDALGELQRLSSEETIHLALTDTLRQVVEEFDWTQSNRGEIPVRINMFLAQLFLQQHSALVTIDTDRVDTHTAHPLPKGSSNAGLPLFWSDEVGKICWLHAQETKGREFFIGIACEHAFSGDALGKYDNPDNLPCLPLVGPDELDTLTNAYTWEIPSNIHNQSVSFKDAYKHCSRLGAQRIENPSGHGGSHYKVLFRGKRPWILDPNNDPIPDRFLKELEDITGFPLAYIKTVLVTGNIPKLQLRLPQREHKYEAQNKA